MTPTPPPQILSGQEVFDLLMSKIEPELTSEGRKTLNEKYKHETPEQMRARKEKYQKAFEAYDKAYAEYVQKQRRELSQYSHSSFTDIENDSKMKEEQALSSLSASFS